MTRRLWVLLVVLIVWAVAARYLFVEAVPWRWDG